MVFELNLSVRRVVDGQTKDTLHRTVLYDNVGVPNKI
jgi:hypothetical protein